MILNDVGIWLCNRQKAGDRNRLFLIVNDRRGNGWSTFGNEVVLWFLKWLKLAEGLEIDCGTWSAAWGD